MTPSWLLLGALWKQPVRRGSAKVLHKWTLLVRKGWRDCRATCATEQGAEEMIALFGKSHKAGWDRNTI